MADLATVGLRIENGQAVAALGQMDTAFDRTTQKIADSRVKFEAWQRQLANKAAAAAAAESTARLNAEIERTNSQTSLATGGIGRFRGGLSSLASQVIGLNPQVSQLASLLGTFAIGSGPMVAILAGIAAVSYAYQQLTSDTRKAREEQEHFFESLRKSAQAAKDATVSGSQLRVEQAKAIEADALAAQRKFNETGGGPSWQANLVSGRVTQAREDRLLAEANAAKILAAANQDIANKQMASERAIFEFERSAAEQLKRIDGEREAAYQKRVALAKAEAAEQERLARLAGEHARQEEERTQRIAKAIADMIRARAAEREEAQKLLSIEIDIDALRRDIAKNVNDALAAEAAAKKYAEDMRQIWRQGFAKIVTDGTKSFRDFFEDVLQMFTRLMSRMEQEGKASGGMYKWLGIGSAAIGGAFGGYQVGQNVGSAGAGALGGAVGGAASGFAIAGPIGAVVGGLAGLTGGLIGGGKAAHDFAMAMLEAQKQVVATIADLHDVAQGTVGSLESQIRHTQEQFDAARNAAIAASVGHGTWWESPAGKAALAAQLAQLKADEDLTIQHLREADAAKKAADALNALTTSAQNAPTGFKIESYINRFAAPRPGYPGGGMIPTPFSPQGGPSSPRTSVNIATVNISLPNVTRPSEVGPAVMKFLDGVRDVTLGPNATRADAMEFA